MRHCFCCRGSPIYAGFTLFQADSFFCMPGSRLIFLKLDDMSIPCTFCSCAVVSFTMTPDNLPCARSAAQVIVLSSRAHAAQWWQRDRIDRRKQDNAIKAMLCVFCISGSMKPDSSGGDQVNQALPIGWETAPHIRCIRFCAWSRTVAALLLVKKFDMCAPCICTSTTFPNNTQSGHGHVRQQI